MNYMNEWDEEVESSSFRWLIQQGDETEICSE